MFFRKATEGLYSTRSPLHGYRREIGHAFLCYCEESLLPLDRTKLVNELKFIHSKNFELTKEGYAKLSFVSGENYQEMVAEVIDQILDNSSNPLVREIINVLKA